MGFKKWVFKRIGGYARKRAFSLLPLDFEVPLRPCRQGQKEEEGPKMPILGMSSNF